MELTVGVDIMGVAAGMQEVATVVASVVASVVATAVEVVAITGDLVTGESLY